MPKLVPYCRFEVHCAVDLGVGHHVSSSGPLRSESQVGNEALVEREAVTLPLDHELRL